MSTGLSSPDPGVRGGDCPEVLDAPDNVRSWSERDNAGILEGISVAAGWTSSARYAATSAARLALLSAREFLRPMLSMVSLERSDFPELECENSLKLRDRLRLCMFGRTAERGETFLGDLGDILVPNSNDFSKSSKVDPSDKSS